jgi:hypothetical protein
MIYLFKEKAVYDDVIREKKKYFSQMREMGRDKNGMYILDVDPPIGENILYCESFIVWEFQNELFYVPSIQVNISDVRVLEALKENGYRLYQNHPIGHWYYIWDITLKHSEIFVLKNGVKIQLLGSGLKIYDR